MPFPGISASLTHKLARKSGCSVSMPESMTQTRTSRDPVSLDHAKGSPGAPGITPAPRSPHCWPIAGSFGCPRNGAAVVTVAHGCVASLPARSSARPCCVGRFCWRLVCAVCAVRARWSSRHACTGAPACRATVGTEGDYALWRMHGFASGCPCIRFRCAQQALDASVSTDVHTGLQRTARTVRSAGYAQQQPQAFQLQLLGRMALGSGGRSRQGLLHRFWPMIVHLRGKPSEHECSQKKQTKQMAFARGAAREELHVGCSCPPTRLHPLCAGPESALCSIQQIGSLYSSRRPAPPRGRT